MQQTKENSMCSTCPIIIKVEVNKEDNKNSDIKMGKESKTSSLTEEIIRVSDFY